MMSNGSLAERKEALIGQLMEVRGEVERLQERLNDMRMQQRRLRERMTMHEVRSVERWELQMYLDEIRAEIGTIKSSPDSASEEAQFEIRCIIDVARMRINQVKAQL